MYEIRDRLSDVSLDTLVDLSLIEFALAFPEESDVFICGIKSPCRGVDVLLVIATNEHHNPLAS
jgi:hypothetical protein